MQRKDWLSLVAVHSDAWLLSVAFFFGARFGFDKSDRTRLFTMINDLPTVFEVVTGTAKKQEKEKPSVLNHNNNKSNSSANGVADRCNFFFWVENDSAAQESISETTSSMGFAISDDEKWRNNVISKLKKLHFKIRRLSWAIMVLYMVLGFMLGLLWKR